MRTRSAAARDRFYRLRDARTQAYLARTPPVNEPVAVHAGEDACTVPEGQLILLALVNQLMRFHRDVRVELSNPAAPLLMPPLQGGSNLADELVNLATAIDPFGMFELGTKLPSSKPALSLGIGQFCPAGLDWYLACDRSLGQLALSPSSLGPRKGDNLAGAGVAAVLGAAAATKTVLGIPVVPRMLSAWNFEEGDAADSGPPGLPPIDVGRTLMIGAGAVANSAAYWLMQWGCRGHWTVVDADRVALHNTNRSLMFFPRDAGWPNGPQRLKTRCLTRYLPGFRAIDEWYDQADVIQDEIFDTVLVLANDRNVRTLASLRNDPIQLEATTSPTWRAQLHRHVIHLDDCPGCRMAEVATATFDCGSVPIVNQQEPEQTDAALPFLSAASGLMLASALRRLQAGELCASRSNIWSWDFRSGLAMTQDGIRMCDDDCTNRLPRESVRRIATSTRWKGEPWLVCAFT